MYQVSIKKKKEESTKTFEVMNVQNAAVLPAESPSPLSFFKEATESTMASVYVFALVALREVARKGLLSKEDAEEVLQLPVDGQRFRRLAAKHESHWLKIKDRDIFPKHDAYKEKQGLSRMNLVVEYIGDEKSDKECVHFIGYEHTRKCIMCVFRGSITMQDWIQDAQLLLAPIPNPIKDTDGQPETVGVHRGFSAYMHGTASLPGSGLREAASSLLPNHSAGTGSKRGNSPTVTKIDTILHELRDLKEKYPSYSIYIQGHSLGGALSLIAALSIASDPILTQMPPDSPPGIVPVTCITIGNPKPGDGDFCRAIELLEMTQKLRCCVIHNSYDIVPMLATNVRGSDKGFWHPGFRVLLYKDRFEWGRGRGSSSDYQAKSNKVSMDREEEEEEVDVGCSCLPRSVKSRTITSSLWAVPENFNPVQAANNMTKQRLNRHDHREYLERLLDQEEELTKVKMDDFYHEMWEADPGNRSGM